MGRVIRYEPMNYFRGYFMEVTEETRNSRNGRIMAKPVANLHIIVEDCSIFFDDVPKRQLPRLVIRNHTTGASETRARVDISQEEIDEALDVMVAAYSRERGNIRVYGKRR